VRPLSFYLPVYRGDLHGLTQLSMGLWLYDLLALFRTPGFHKRLSKEALLKLVPELSADKLAGGFRYFDASMWDDMLVLETLRSAVRLGAAVANYVEAVKPIRVDGRVCGFEVRNLENQKSISIRAKRVIATVGPWADELGQRVHDQSWKPWLSPSQGVHLVFDFKRLPIPGALVMSHPQDGRISFAIPRSDLGGGVTLVGTTDGPVQGTTADPLVKASDVEYLMSLLTQYFPKLGLTKADILSAYVGIRPLVGAGMGAQSLQKVSREHSIELGSEGMTWVAGGKYTTHRKMAEEIVDFTLTHWKKEEPSIGENWIESRTDLPVNEPALKGRPRKVRTEKDRLFDLYGMEAVEILRIDADTRKKMDITLADPEGFPALLGQLLFAMRRYSVVHLEDFYLRRVPLVLSRMDHGEPWIDLLAKVWAQERKLDFAAGEAESKRLRAEIKKRESWRS
jgi:glycerol-3-phosphate dehydrogenase